MVNRKEGPYEEFLRELINERKRKLENSKNEKEVEKLKKEIEFLEREINRYKEKMLAQRPLEFKP